MNKDHWSEIPDHYVTEGIPEFVATLFPKDFKGVCVDVGACQPKWINNSWIFEQAGWECWCIEPNPSCIAKLREQRKHVLEYACSDQYNDEAMLHVYFALPCIGEAGGTALVVHEECKDKEVRCVPVRARTLDWLMENEIHQDRIDYLSVDVERTEIKVFHGITLERWNPKVISVEVHQNVTSQYELTDGYLEARGYKKVNRVGFDNIYVRNES